MKLPRDVSGLELAKSLRKFGYEITRQKGSHVRVTTQRNGEHHEVIPNHNPIRIGTFNSILKSISTHHQMTVEGLLNALDL